ncbi:MAG: cation diffusion facilitator family transporter [Lachnospiraceae bacterium]|nr:cation diffusion facilitator family transporter [Lachnospiraceae bacterium]
MEESKSFEVEKENREKAIVRTSVVGIAVNIALVAFKAVVGLLSNSIAIILDAVNNLSDALSSVITIIGTKLGAIKPNKKHPLGYGRIEYLSSMLVSALVIYAGITSLVESIKKIINPETADYSYVSLAIISVAVVVKILLGRYVKKQGKKYNSGALTASGSDAMLDAVVSATVLVSAVIYFIWHISLEAYVGVVISLLIMKAGIEMMNETLNDILGRRSEREEIKKLKKIICEVPGVRGAYDLILYNYGPNKNYGTVHIELPDTMRVDEVDRLSRRIQEKVLVESGVILTGIGVYSHNTSDDESAKMRNAIQKTVMSHEWALQLHGFYVDLENKRLRFDLVLSFDVDKTEAIDIATSEVQNMYPDFEVHITPDIDA